MQRRQFLKWAAISGAAATAYQFKSLRAAENIAPDTAVGPSSARIPISGNDVRFLLFGDWGSGNSLQKSVARAMSEYCVEVRQAHQPIDFAISVGDNFYNDGVKNPADAQWETKFEAMYPASVMAFPFYAVLGNHDWRLDPDAQLAYGQKPGTRWNMDGFYYSRTVGGSIAAPLAEIFFFDTDLWLPQYNVEGLGQRQLKWLDGALSDSKARWKFLVGHHPPFTDGEHALEKDIPIVHDNLVPLCQKYGVDAVFSGHDHDMQRIEIADIPTHFVICGAGGASLRPRKTQNYGPFYRDMTGGFLSVELNENALKGAFRGVEGESLHEWTQKPRAA